VVRCARVDRVLALALGTLLVCGVINTALAVIEGAWWAWGVGGACLTVASVVAKRWFQPPRAQRAPHVAPAKRPKRLLLDRDDVNAAA
jgi:hypothetical protein